MAGRLVLLGWPYMVLVLLGWPYNVTYFTEGFCQIDVWRGWFCG